MILEMHERPSFDDDQFGNFFEVRCGIVQLQMETCARRKYFKGILIVPDQQS